MRSDLAGSGGASKNIKNAVPAILLAMRDSKNAVLCANLLWRVTKSEEKWATLLPIWRLKRITNSNHKMGFILYKALWMLRNTLEWWMLESVPLFREKKTRIETYFFDFKGNLYGKKIRINLLEKIRDEQKFDSLDALKNQLNTDQKSCQKLIPIHL